MAETDLRQVDPKTMLLIAAALIGAAVLLGPYVGLHLLSSPPNSGSTTNAVSTQLDRGTVPISQRPYDTPVKHRAPRPQGVAGSDRNQPTSNSGSTRKEDDYQGLSEIEDLLR